MMIPQNIAILPAVAKGKLQMNAANRRSGQQHKARMMLTGQVSRFQHYASGE
jgi:hypothetical protein